MLSPFLLTSSQKIEKKLDVPKISDTEPLESGTLNELTQDSYHLTQEFQGTHDAPPPNITSIISEGSGNRTGRVDPRQLVPKLDLKGSLGLNAAFSSPLSTPTGSPRVTPGRVTPGKVIDGIDGRRESAPITSITIAPRSREVTPRLTPRETPRETIGTEESEDMVDEPVEGVASKRPSTAGPLRILGESPPSSPRLKTQP